MIDGFISFNLIWLFFFSLSFFFLFPKLPIVIAGHDKIENIELHVQQQSQQHFKKIKRESENRNWRQLVSRELSHETNAENKTVFSSFPNSSHNPTINK